MAPVPLPRPVPLADLETAQRIAAAARSGRPADRNPTLAQLLAAFGEPAATPQARERISAALALAGVRTEPAIADADEGARVSLRTPGSSRSPVRALQGAAALVAVIGVAVLLSALNGDDKRVSSLPATSARTTTTATTPDATATTGGASADTTPASTETTPPSTGTTPTSTTPTATTGGASATTTAPSTTSTTDGIPDDFSPSQTTPSSSKPTGTTAAQRAAARKRAVGRRLARRKRAAAAQRRVTVRLTPARPTFLCADDGAGRVLFSGTLSERRTFRVRRIRLNVGLGPSTAVTVNGRPLVLARSPSGYLISRARTAPLPEGSRPEC